MVDPIVELLGEIAKATGRGQAAHTATAVLQAALIGVLTRQLGTDFASQLLARIEALASDDSMSSGMAPEDLATYKTILEAIATSIREHLSQHGESD